MSVFRRIVLLLLVISLPGYGWAVTGMSACSMQKVPMSQRSMSQVSMPSMSVQQQSIQEQSIDQAPAMHSVNAAAHSGHCCPEQPTKHGDAKQQGCQDGQCHCSALYQATQSLAALVIPATDSFIPATPFQLITTAALPLWRPPTVN